MSVRRILKHLGLALLAIISVIGIFAGNVYLLHKAITFDSPEAVAQRFGEFKEGEQLKLKKVNDFQLMLVGVFGAILPEFTGVGSFRSIDMYSLAYKSDGLTITGVVVLPEEDGDFPALVFNRGGNRDFGSLTIGSVSVWLAPYARDGYAVVASNYRGGGGSEGEDEFGGGDLNDVFNLISSLSDIKKVDESRLGMLGHSRGGIMTYLSLKRSEQIRAAVVVSGIADLIQTKNNRPEMEAWVYSKIIPEYALRGDELLRERSATYWPGELSRSTPLLIFHGDQDERVNYSEARHLADLLVQSEHPFVFVTSNGDGHMLRNSMSEVRAITTRWLDRYLRDGLSFDEPVREITLGL